MPLYKHLRTGETVAADAEFIEAAGADNYEKVADESRDEARAREIAEARAAKVELDYDDEAPADGSIVAPAEGNDA